MDSGAELNLISSDLVEQLNLPSQSLDQPQIVAGITGQNITRISSKVCDLNVVISGNHPEVGEFLIFDSFTPQLVFSFPWLARNNPVIIWAERGWRGLEFILLKALFGICYHHLS